MLPSRQSEDHRRIRDRVRAADRIAPRAVSAWAVSTSIVAAAPHVWAGLLTSACFSRLNLPTQPLQFFVLRYEFAVGILQRHER
jgi:hypothetical protein